VTASEDSSNLLPALTLAPQPIQPSKARITNSNNFLGILLLNQKFKPSKRRDEKFVLDVAEMTLNVGGDEPLVAFGYNLGACETISSSPSLELQ